MKFSRRGVKAFLNMFNETRNSLSPRRSPSWRREEQQAVRTAREPAGGVGGEPRDQGLELLGRARIRIGGRVEEHGVVRADGRVAIQRPPIRGVASPGQQGSLNQNRNR